MTGTPIENRLGELWAIMDIVNPGLLGSRESFDRTLARPIEAYGDEKALERLRGIVRPFVLRRAKDDPEVELELPPITIGKDYCKLTVEQASLYQATVDRWMPRIEEQQETFGQRGSVLAMLSQLKRVIRTNYSNPPTHGGQIVATVLGAEFLVGLEVEIALVLAHRDVVLLHEAQHFGIEVQGLLLVVDVQVGQFDFHFFSPLSRSRFGARRVPVFVFVGVDGSMRSR